MKSAELCYRISGTWMPFGAFPPFLHHSQREGNLNQSGGFLRVLNWRLPACVRISTLLRNQLLADRVQAILWAHFSNFWDGETEWTVESYTGSGLALKGFKISCHLWISTWISSLFFPQNSIGEGHVFEMISCFNSELSISWISWDTSTNNLCVTCHWGISDIWWLCEWVMSRLSSCPQHPCYTYIPTCTGQVVCARGQPLWDLGVVIITA